MYSKVYATKFPRNIKTICNIIALLIIIHLGRYSC